MLNKVKIFSKERLDLPDFQHVLDFTEDELQIWTKNIFAGTSDSYILTGFEPSVVANLDITIQIANSALFNTKATGILSGSTYVAESGTADLALTLSDNTTNYVHAVVNSVGGGADVRVFWDRTANNGEGGEWQQVVNTVDSLGVSLYVSTAGWSIDPNKIPLFYATTAAGIVASMVDYRNLFFRLGRPGNPTYTDFLTDRTEPNPDKISQATAFTAADKEITSFKQWMDVVMSAIKEIKWGSGTNKWYQQAPSSLTQGNDVLTAGGTWTWYVADPDAGGPLLANSLYFDADAVVIMYGNPFINTISFAASSPITLLDGEVAYVDLNRTASVVVPVSVTTALAYISDPDRLIIAKRIGGTVYVGNTPLILNDTDSGTLSIAITAAFATYVGAPNFSPPAPDYNASGIAPDTVSYITNGADDLTLAIAKHDVVLQEMSLQLSPIGSMQPFYDYNGLVAFDANYWAWCDGSVVGGAGPLAGQTLPDMSNRYLVGFGTEAGGDIDTAAWATAAVGAANHQINILHGHTNYGHYHSRGTLSGTYAGNTGYISADHYHTGTTSSAGSHTHNVTYTGGGDGGTVFIGSVQVKTTDQLSSSSQTTTASPLHSHTMSTGGVSSNHTHAYSGSVSFGGAIGNTGSGINGDNNQATSNNLSATQSIQPRSIRCRFIMRIQ